MKRILYKSFRLTLTIVALVLFVFVVFYFFNSVGLTEINCIAIDEQTGRIAISFFKDGYGIVRVFGQDGVLIYEKKLYDDGGGIHHLSFDQSGFLHVYLGRTREEKVYDNDGNPSLTDCTHDWDIYWYDDWEKHGSSYSKTVGEYVYCYNYPALFEYIRHPVHEVQITDKEGQVVTIWSSEK